MTPAALLDYLESVLDCDALRRLDQSSLHKLENLLHHWYVLIGDVRRQKAKAATESQLARAKAAPAFTLRGHPGDDPSPLGTYPDEHAIHLGVG